MADVSDATNAANIASATNLVEINLGLDQTPQSDWTQDQMIQFISGLSAQVLANPQSFSDQEVANAQSISSTNLSTLELQDPSFDWDQFGQDLEDNATAAGSDIASLGTGISNAINSIGQSITSAGNALSNTATLAQVGIPLILVAIVIFAFNTKKVAAKGYSAST